MTFERGHPKYAGRQVGTVNKSKLLELIDERFPGFHPILAMIEMFRDTENPPEVRARLLSEITTYTVPRLKPMEPMEARRLTDEAVLSLVAGDGEPIDTFIQAFLDGRLSASDLSSLVAALSLKQKGQGQTVDEQAELLRLIKSQ